MILVGRIFALLLSIILAVGACAQALSNIYVKNAPTLAASLSPFTSEAYERLAVRTLQADQQEQVMTTPVSIEFARKAYRASPLATEALAILALSQPTMKKREIAIEAAQNLSRRGRVLSIVSLQSSIEREDAAGGIAALDRLLRVYPGFSGRMMTPLIAYIAQPGAVPAFERILALEPEWRNAFFMAKPPGIDGLRNLAMLRLTLGPDYPLEDGTELRLIQQLIAEDLWTEALALRDMGASGSALSKDGTISWANANPVFDWELADERGFYARPDPEFQDVRVKVEPGQGGVLARRLLKLPDAVRALTFDHSLQPARDLENFLLEVTCAKTKASLGKTSLARPSGRVNIVGAPCEWVYITVSGRVWSTGREVSGRVDALALAR